MTFVELKSLYEFLSRRQPVAAAQEEMAAIYEKVRKAGDTDALRLSRSPYKKLQDEVRPALIYAVSELPHGDIQFHLTDKGPDATAWPDACSSPITIEVTVASGKVRYHQMKALNEIGMGHGFTDATDADTPEYIKTRYEDYRAYSPLDVAKNIEAGVHTCVNRKATESHRDHTLIIYAPSLQLFPSQDWDRYMPELAHGLPQSPCRAIYLVGGTFSGDVCYRLK
jgi:hypothetical protein